MVRGDLAPYRSPVDGRWVDSATSRRDDLRRNGCIEWEPGIRQDIGKIKEANEAKRFAPVAETIDNVVREMVSAGKIPT